MRRFLAFFAITALYASTIAPTMAHAQEASYMDEPQPAASIGPRFAPGELLVKFRADAREAEKIDLRSRLGARLKERIHTLPMKEAGEGELQRLTIPRGRTLIEAIRELEGHPAVAFAEPNWIVTHQAVSNDPYYTNGSLWGMYGDATSPANQYGSQAGEAWANNHTGSSAVYVGVIDEGIDYRHEDLSANIWTNPYDPPDGIDNDGNGYVDDVHGWDFYDNDNSIYDGAPGDNSTDSHGTHVAGTIGGVGGNGKGVVGVNWRVTIISAKFLGPTGGTYRMPSKPSITSRTSSVATG